MLERSAPIKALHRNNVLNRIFKRIMDDGQITQYSLRHTFATKCQEYVPPNIIDIWMDIAPKGLSDGFTRIFPTSFYKGANGQSDFRYLSAIYSPNRSPNVPIYTIYIHFLCKNSTKKADYRFFIR